MLSSRTRSLASALAVSTLLPFLACGGGGGGSSSSSSSTPSGSGIQVLLNGDLESSAPLAWSDPGGIIQTAPGASYPYAVPHGGTHFAWLDGYGSVATDTISQDFYIPSTAQTAQATFWLKIVTSESGAVAKDVLTVQARSTSGSVLGTLTTKSNVDAGANYVQYTVDLLPYKGQVVRLYFQGVEDAANATSFLLDDVAVNVTVPATTDLKPVITSFTPSSGVLGIDTVQISGGSFFGVTNVSIGGASASFTITDGTSLSATVPAGATPGAALITVTNAHGQGASASNFTSSQGTPTISAINPTQGPVGTPVIIDGAYLGYVGTTVTINGTPATIATQSQTQLKVTVPVGATSGNLVVTTPSGSAAPVAFTVNSVSTSLDFHIDKLQLTQSTQTLGNSVQIVAGKDGLIRAFVLANQTNTAMPSVQVTLLNNGIPVAGYPKSISAPVSAIPTTLNEGSLTSSWNVAVPGTDLAAPTGSGYSLQATVDPSHAIAQADTTNDTKTVAISGTAVATFKTTIFPVVLASGNGNITAGNSASWVARLKKMYPVADVDIVVGAPFMGSVSTLVSDDADGHWNTLLSDLATKHQADATSDRYYYGALNVSYSSGVAGLGYVPGSSSSGFKFRTAIGWDKTGYSDGGNYPEVYAHETGHNMGRPHSPCGGAGSPDPNYPYANAFIGVWGYDSVANVLKDPAVYHDTMAYCTPNWVSDYVYTKILQFRAGSGGFLTVGAPQTQATPECLLVRGIVHEDGSVTMLPAFRTRALPSTATEGDWKVEGQDLQGRTLFSASLELMEVGCSLKGDRHFVMALPLEASTMDALNALQIRREGQLVTERHSPFASARLVVTEPTARRLDAERLDLGWDASAHEAILVRDGDTGEVIAILAKGGRQTLPTQAKRLELVLSDGVSSQTRRLEVAR